MTYSWPLQCSHNAPPPTVLMKPYFFLTSDSGVEGDAHTAVGVVGLHGNFPRTPGTMTERQGGLDAGHALM